MCVYIHTLTHTFQSQTGMNHKCLDLIVVNISITIMVWELKKTQIKYLRALRLLDMRDLFCSSFLKCIFERGNFFFEIVVQNVCVCVFFLIGFECERRGKKFCLTNVSLSFFLLHCSSLPNFYFYFKKNTSCQIIENNKSKTIRSKEIKTNQQQIQSNSIGENKK